MSDSSGSRAGSEWKGRDMPAKRSYEAPKVQSLGSLRDMTQAQSWFKLWDSKGLLPPINLSR